MFAAASKTASSSAPVYIEDVFSTWLYTGNGSTQTITNGIDLSTKGGLVWCKNRASNLSGSEAHEWYDTVRGAGYGIFSNATSAQQNYGSSRGVTAFSTTGFTVTNSSTYIGPNADGITEVGWTFRKQAKFFDIVTYTGNGSTQNIAHNLGSVPGCIIVKKTSGATNWGVYHRSLGNAQLIYLNLTDPSGGSSGTWDSTTPTSTQFTVGADAVTNESAQTYVAYLFAHDAGGFGLTGADNVISCGSFTVSSGTGSTDVNLGYEPQWLLAKPSTDPGFATNWNLYDTMRGWVNTTGAGNVNRRLNPNNANPESTDVQFQPTATGFTMLNSNVYPGVSVTYIYIAIRRGPMKTPTSGTSVLSLQTYTGDDSTRTLTTGFPVDLAIGSSLSSSAGNSATFEDRLRGKNTYINTSSTGAETSGGSSVTGFDVQNGIAINGPSNYLYNYGSIPYVLPALRRAPSFFDEVCYTGNSTNNRALNHNLGVAPELIIYKRRNIAADWVVMSSMFSNAGDALFLQSTSAISSNAYSGVPRPTATYFYAGDWGALNNNADTYVAYLFATCAGVSKVGSYTGTGATQTVNCGFTGGARFVLIKRTDDVGDWFFWDTARGMVSGTDPYLLWNANGNQVTGTNYVFTTSVGFQIQSSAPAGINASGGSYIFLAIA